MEKVFVKDMAVNMKTKTKTIRHRRHGLVVTVLDAGDGSITSVLGIPGSLGRSQCSYVITALL